MPNKLYPKGKEYILTNGAMATGAVKAALVNTTIADGPGNFYNQLDTDTFLSDIPASAIVAVGAVLTTKTVSLGVFNADPVTFPLVSGVSVEAVVLYVDTGTSTTSPLIGYFDTITGLPIQPSGADIQIIWDTGPFKIFAI